MQHNILKLEISMYNHDSHHVVEAVNELCHNNLNDFWLQLPLFHLHELFEIATIAELHEYIVSIISLNCLFQPCRKLTFYHVLIIYFIHNKLLFVCCKIFSVYDLAGQKFGVLCIHEFGNLDFLFGLLRNFM